VFFVFDAGQKYLFFKSPFEDLGLKREVCRMSSLIHHYLISGYYNICRSTVMLLVAGFAKYEPWGGL